MDRLTKTVFNGIESKTDNNRFARTTFYSGDKWLMDLLSTDTLIINGNVIDLIESMFPISKDDTLYYIREWCDENLGFRPNAMMKQYRHEY